MAAEMPAKVESVDGADAVDFPWSAAATAIGALNAASSTLGSQLEARATMTPRIVDWTGAFRSEFDGAHARVTSTASGLKETLTRMAFWIVSGAEAANDQQRTNNTNAALTQPVP
jgi:uncharacterized protein YukE